MNQTNILNLDDNFECDTTVELILGIVAGVSSVVAIISECIGVSKCKKNSLVELLVVKKLLQKEEELKEIELKEIEL